MPRNKSEQQPVRIANYSNEGPDVTQVLWQIGNDYYITSKIENPERAETLVFHADRMGRITSFAELYGSQRGPWPHEMAISAYYVYTQKRSLRKDIDAPQQKSKTA